MSIKLSHQQAPLFEELLRYSKESRHAFHTPGHKAGKGLESSWQEAGLLTKLDLTEISALNWSESLAWAEELAAELYHADGSFFLTQGATQGIIGGILGVFHPGETVLVARNCHDAALKGIILAGLNPVYVEVEYLPGWDLPLGIKLDSFSKEIVKHPHSKGLIITNPTYQGIAHQVGLYRKLIGARILLVDEAHGGHLGWSGFPGYDAYEHADLWVQGTHKILGSLTQTGILHYKKQLNRLRLKQGLDLITTTSPSYVLLASLDSNRRFLTTTGQRLFRERVPIVRELKEQLITEGLTVLTEAELDRKSVIVDPWKLSVRFDISGYQAALLLQKFKIQPEYADSKQVSFIISPWQSDQDLQRLFQALVQINRHRQNTTVCPILATQSIPARILAPREAILSPRETVPIDRAIGRVAAASLCPYPPGIPLVVPGELIRIEEITLIREILKQGGLVQGITPDEEIFVTI